MSHFTYLPILFCNTTAKLPKWFGERPGKKAGDSETPEGEEEAAREDEVVEEEEEVNYLNSIN